MKETAAKPDPTFEVVAKKRPARADRSSPAALDARAAVRYRIDPIDPKGHYFAVVCEVDEPDPQGQVLSLPAWIPGSYMIREFARNIVAIDCECRGRPLALVKLDKHSWRAAACDGPLTARYRVYAWDPSVRAAHLDETHAFFNGTSVFLKVDGHEHQVHEVDVLAPSVPSRSGWRVATTLREHGAARHGFGTYRAADYDELIDHPFEIGRFRLERFVAAGLPHEIAWTGVVPNLDAARINADLAVLCAAQIRFFADRPHANGEKAAKRAAKPATETDAPFDRYVFLTSVAAEGYGGLEHRASTALLCARDGLPVLDRDTDETTAKRASPARSGGYLTFLGLVSHEYFHSWNVKRIKPAAFAPYDLAHETYTSLLWIFEGFTSYYDDLFLVRTGLATEDQYFEMLAKTIDDVMAGPGRATQSVAESSFDAWVKYYRQDENAPNAVVSYYKKGSLVALCLDLLIRAESRGKKSLDDAMRLMWKRYGRDFYAGGGRGIGEDEFPALVREATGVDVSAAVGRWAYATDDLPLAALLSSVGVALAFEPQRATPSLGARIANGAGDVRLSAVSNGGAAHDAGLSAGDVLVAIDDLRVVPGRLDALLARCRVGDLVQVSAFRGDVLQRRSVKLEAAPQRAVVTARPKPGDKAAKLRAAWLSGSRKPAR